MKKQFSSSFLILLLISLMLCSCFPKKYKCVPDLSAERALGSLMEGNKRYINNKPQHPNQNQASRNKLIQSQSPFAVIVGCSDSRVPPEIIFDQGLGDLFVVRVAGNVIGPVELESIEFAALVLHAPIILVLGHENCAAVDSVLQNNTAGMEEIADLISPSIKDIKKDEKNNQLEKAIKNNALNMKALLEKSSDINKLIQENKIKVYAAYYNLKTGVVEVLK